MRSLASKLTKILRLTRSWWALALARARLGKGGLPSDLSIAPGAFMSATDGGSIHFDSGCSIDRNATLIAKLGSLSMGAGSHVGIGSVIVARESIQIGTNVLIAEHVTIRDQNHLFDGFGITSKLGFSTAPIVIGNNVWLGAKVTVTKGVTIGDNTVIGANSVVTRDIPANCVAAGAPTRVLRNLSPKVPVQANSA